MASTTFAAYRVKNLKAGVRKNQPSTGASCCRAFGGGGGALCSSGPPSPLLRELHLLERVTECLFPLASTGSRSDKRRRNDPLVLVRAGRVARGDRFDSTGSRSEKRRRNDPLALVWAGRVARGDRFEVELRDACSSSEANIDTTASLLLDGNGGGVGGGVGGGRSRLLACSVSSSALSTRR